MANLSNLNPELLRVISEYAGVSDSLSLRNTSTSIRSVFTDRPIETIRNQNTSHKKFIYMFFHFVNQFVKGIIYMATRDPYTSVEEYVQDLVNILTLRYDMNKPCGLYASEVLNSYATDFGSYMYDNFMNNGNSSNIEDPRIDINAVVKLSKNLKCGRYLLGYIRNQECIHDSIIEPNVRGIVSVTVTRYLKAVFHQIKGLLRKSEIKYFLDKPLRSEDNLPRPKDTVIGQYEKMIIHSVKMALQEIENNLRVAPETVQLLYETETFANNNGLMVNVGNGGEIFIVKNGRNIPLRIYTSSIKAIPMTTADFSDYGFDMRRRPAKSVKRSRKPTKKRSTRKGRK